MRRLKALRCLIFVWQLSIVNVLSELSGRVWTRSYDLPRRKSQWSTKRGDHDRERRQFHLLVRSWHPFFGMHVGWFSLIIFKKEKQSSASIMQTYYSVWVMISRETATFGEKESAVSSRQCTSSHTRYRDGQNQWVKVQIASSRTLLARFSLLGLFSLYKLEKMSRWSKICQEWRGEACG